MATVFTCGWEDKYYRDSAGLSGGSYLIIFNYEVDGQWYSGEFLSNAVLEEGTHFPLRYNPDNPEQNDKTADSKSTRLFTFIASILAGAGLIVYEWLHRATPR